MKSLSIPSLSLLSTLLLLAPDSAPLAGAAGHPIQAAVAPVRDLAAYWSFDEGVGRTVYDYSGHNNNGTILGRPQWVAGRIGKALEFNGTDSVIEVADGDWNRGAPITFAVWYRPEGRGIVLE